MNSAMIAEEFPQEDLLREQISAARAKLGVLESDLRDIDNELADLGEQRQTYDLLEDACAALERLDAAGAAGLFWGDYTSGLTNQRVNDARARAGEFLGKVGEVEGRRKALFGEIRQGQDVLDILESDLFELELAEEERQLEWVIDRELVVAERASLMPWASGQDAERFRKTLGSSLLAALILGIVVPFIDLPLPDLELIPEVPDRFARLIEEQAPPPPAPVVEPPPPEIEPEELVAEELIEEAPEIPVEPTPPAAEEPAPEQEVRSAGILAFRDSFANLAADRPSAQLGGQARINDAGQSQIGRTERAMVTSQAPGSSGGINLASLSRDVGGGGTGEGLEGVAAGRVASSIGVSGNGDRPLAAGALAGRTDEEIQIVFDRYKSALYRLYNRELRNNPTLRGQIVLQLTIEPDGSVSFCELQASDMGSPVLEQQIVERVRTFDFGAKEGISAVTILYPIDFLPAA